MLSGMWGPQTREPSLMSNENCIYPVFSSSITLTAFVSSRRRQGLAGQVELYEGDQSQP